AARAAIAGPLTDDPIVGAGLREMIATYLADPDEPPGTA
ncbi:MAG: AAA family ATPase, partial [Acidimicrobiia bacterium]